jgi:glutamyl-tRNA reductase
LAARFGGEAEPWEDLAASLTWPDLIVTSVSSREPVLTRATLEQAMVARGNRPFLIIDLGVPRNVAADAAGLYNLYLYDIDGLTKIVEQNKKARREEIPKAEALVDAQISKFMHWHAGSAACSVLAELTTRPSAERSGIVREHLASMSHLSEEDRNRVTNLVDTFFDSVAHDSQEFLQVLPQFLRKIHER